jgi:hypothetical protein
MNTPRLRIHCRRQTRLFLAALCAGLLDFTSTLAEASDAPVSSPTPVDAAVEIAALTDQIKDLRGHLPGQSHTMIDVAYHFNGLWFAGQAKNWPLAEFLLNETKSHLRWAVRVRPVRPLSNGGEFRVGDMLTAIEQGTLKDLTESVQAKDQSGFVTAYKQQLASCYACHVAAEKPYLRLRIPERPAETMLEFDPTRPGSPGS